MLIFFPDAKKRQVQPTENLGSSRSKDIKNVSGYRLFLIRLEDKCNKLNVNDNLNSLVSEKANKNTPESSSVINRNNTVSPTKMEAEFLSIYGSSSQPKDHSQKLTLKSVLKSGAW